MHGVTVMVKEKYGVRLAPEERDWLEHLIRAGKSPARITARARILLKTSEGWSAPKVAGALDVGALDVSEGTVYLIKRRFAEEGLVGVLQDRPHPKRPRKLDDRGEARLIAPGSWPGAGSGPAARPLRGTTTGPCGCWPGRWWSWGWRLRCPMRGSASVSKKRPQTVAEEGVVHSQGERRLCSLHRRRLGPV